MRQQHRLGRQAVMLVALLIGAICGPLAPAALAAGQEPQTLALADAPAQVIVGVPVLNVRAGPGTTYAIVGRTTAGTALNVQGRSAAGDWLQVRTPDGATGWVSAQLVGPADNSASSTAAPAGSPTRIVAPTIKLDAKVVPEGWHDVRAADGSVTAEWDVPMYATGWLINSGLPGQVGNTVLSGHHNIYGQVFRYVVNLNVGDPITLYVGDRTYNYRISDKFIIPDKYVSAEQRVQNARWIGSFGDERLTLVTCWPYTNNTHRVIVIARPMAAQ